MARVTGGRHQPGKGTRAATIAPRAREASFATALLPLVVPIDSLTLDPANARRHSVRNLAAIEASLMRFGQRKPVVCQRVVGSGALVVRAGNGTVAAARKLGWDKIAAIVIDEDDMTATAYAIADNRTGELAEWDDDVLGKLMVAIAEEDKELVGLLGFDDDEMAKLTGVGAAAGKTDPDDVPETPVEPVTRSGDLWVMGEHRLLCGDSTKADDVARLLAGAHVDLVCTDPPYCSGGFQEAGKSQGSVGTGAAHKHVANDRLSTRGYQALLKAAFSNIGSLYIYAFTDWRMWIHLFDVVESGGYGVRSMIVWDKGTPGMGRGWRAQHELILWGCRETPPFDKYAPGVGNVIAASRSGNKHHTTEKPVALMEALIGNVPFVKVVADPFNGSGSTLIACQRLARVYRGAELDAAYMDVSVRRWCGYTGLDATRESDGASFRELTGMTKPAIGG